MVVSFPLDKVHFQLTLFQYIFDILPTITQAYLGSPVTKFIKHKNTILGVVLQRYTTRTGTIFRFIRSNYIFRDVQELVERLKSEKATDTNHVSSNKSFPSVTIKSRKFK